MRTIIIILILASAAQAAEVYHPTIRLKGGIEVYEAVLSAEIPADLKKLTAEQWFAAANAQNLMAKKVRRKAAHRQDGHTRYATMTESSGYSQTRFGGGVGAGGYGGSGGYSGYLGTESPSGGGYGGYASGRPGNSVQTRGGSSSVSYTAEYKPWPVFNGGDLEILNPYVRPK